MTDKRISLWSGPRNVSTALMYSFAQRPDTKVVDEPFYGHYLRISGAQHPGRDEVLQHMELNGEVVVEEMCQGDFGAPNLFIKNMAHHLVSLDLTFLESLQNLLLIRDPKEMIPSLTKQIPQPIMRDTGLKRQWELYEHLTSVGLTPVIIDSRELLLSPEKSLEHVCQSLNIPYFTEMTNWTPQSLAEDGIWAKYWYHNVHKSSGFKPYQPKKELVPDHLGDLLKECEYYYQLLSEHAIRFTG